MKQLQQLCHARAPPLEQQPQQHNAKTSTMDQRDVDDVARTSMDFSRPHSPPTDALSIEAWTRSDIHALTLLLLLLSHTGARARASNVGYTVTRARRGVGLTPGITGMWLAWGAAHPGHHGRGCGPGCFYHARGAVHPGPRFDNMEYVIYILPQ